MHDGFGNNAGPRSGNMPWMKEKLEENRFKQDGGNPSLFMLQLEQENLVVLGCERYLTVRLAT